MSATQRERTVSAQPSYVSYRPQGRNQTTPPTDRLRLMASTIGASVWPPATAMTRYSYAVAERPQRAICILNRVSLSATRHTLDVN